MPAAIKDWKAINKSRPEERKKVDQKTRKFLPVTDIVIENHLLGNETVGVYPLLPDETCWFLAADFDKKTWQDDSRRSSRPAGAECSGGPGTVAFREGRPRLDLLRRVHCQRLPRANWVRLLTRTMERRHQIGLDSYDRFFPNQDTMPKGGFGNLIALPLQCCPGRRQQCVH